MHKLSKFTQKGHERFIEIYKDIYKFVTKEGWENLDSNYFDDLEELKNEKTCFEILDDNTQFDKYEFNTAYEFGEYIRHKLLALENRDILFDKFLWDRLSLLYFNILIPKSGKYASSHRYILSDEWQHRNRHLVRTPWYLNITYGKYSKLFKSVLTNQGGDWTEQFISFRDTEKYVISGEVAYNLYYDKIREKALSGYSKRFTKKNGKKVEVKASLYRLIQLFKQYSQMYNINSMSSDDFISLLPSEFDNLKKK